MPRSQNTVSTFGSSTISKRAKPQLTRSDLHPYQNRTVEFIKANPRAALWLDMGLGKTVSTLTALSDLLADFELFKVLVIAPKRVAEYTWPNELGLWEHLSHITHTVIAGPPAKREQAVRQGTNIHIISRDNVVWLVDKLRGKWPYDCIVIDESSSFKNPSSKRFRALRKVAPVTPGIIELTGTPTSNGLLDLWSQIFLLDGGAALGKTFGAYKNRYFRASGYMGYDLKLNDGADAEIHAAVAPLCLRLAADDYLEMPERIDNHIAVHLPAKARAQYDDLEKAFLLRLETADVPVLSAAALTNKLLQVANGHVYDESGEYHPLHEAKLDALASVIEEAAGAPVLVAYNYRSDQDRIRQRFPGAVDIKDSDDTQARWNNGEIPLLMAHPGSAGHGLNLQAGGSIICWYGLNWSLELYAQFNARLHRQGQQKPVVVHHIVAQDTVDTTVLAALATKDTTQKALLNAVRDDMRRRHR